MRGLRFIFITAAIAAIMALLIISGCTQQPQQQQPQAQPEKKPAQEAAAPPASQPAASQQQPVPSKQPATEQDDLYRDNLEGALDDLSQLE